MSSNDASQPSVPTLMDRMRQQLNMLAFISSVLTAFAEVALFRARFGERYFQGVKTAAVIPVLLVFPLFWPRHSPAPVLLMLLLYLVMCVVHRASIARRRLRGERGIHSFYNGVSRLEKRYPNVSETTLKSRYEPLMMLLMGLGTLIISPPLGWLFIWTSVAMAARAKLLMAHDRQRELDLADAQIEGGQLAGTLPGRARAASSVSVVSIHRSQP